MEPGCSRNNNSSPIAIDPKPDVLGDFIYRAGEEMSGGATLNARLVTSVAMPTPIFMSWDAAAPVAAVPAAKPFVVAMPTDRGRILRASRRPASIRSENA